MSSCLPIIEHAVGRPSPFYAQETSKRKKHNNSEKWISSLDCEKTERFKF
jgi:hypothetical protein